MVASLFLGLNPFQWLALILAATTLLIMVDAFVGHYRHSFSYRLQYGPLIAGPLLALPALMTAALPRALWLNQALSLSGWLAVATGFIGFGLSSLLRHCEEARRGHLAPALPHVRRPPSIPLGPERHGFSGDHYFSRSRWRANYLRC
jgi:hypothetical protein